MQYLVKFSYLSRHFRLSYTTVQKFGMIFFMFLKVFYAYQGCIYLIKKFSTFLNKYYYSFLF